MKLETLRTLWQQKNPGGQVWYTDTAGNLADYPIGKSKKLAATFKPEGKVYTYTATVRSLAERYGLIPDDSKADYWAESRKAIAAMNHGESYETTLGLSDTIRNILAEGRYEVELEIGEGVDGFDRVTYIFKSYTKELVC